MKKVFIVLIMVWLYSLGFKGCFNNEVSKEKVESKKEFTIDLSSLMKFEVEALQYPEYSKFKFQKLSGYGFNGYISKDQERIEEWKTWIPQYKYIKDVKVGDMILKMYSFYHKATGKTTYSVFYFGEGKAMRIDSEEGDRGYDYFMAIEETKKIFVNFEMIKLPEGQSVNVKPDLFPTEEEYNKLSKEWYIYPGKWDVPSIVFEQGQFGSIKSLVKDTYYNAKTECVDVRCLMIGEKIFKTQWKVRIIGVNSFGGPAISFATVTFDEYGAISDIKEY